MQINDLISCLEEMSEKYGGHTTVNVYKSFEKQTVNITEVCYDDELKDVYIGIY